MSLLCHSQPDITVTISGTGASIDTDSEAFFDCEVGSVVRNTWASGSQATATTVKYQLAFGSAKHIRAAAILGVIGLPAGTKIQIRGKRVGDSGYTYDLGGNSVSRLRTLEDGSVGLWCVLAADVEALIGIEITIFNDVNGSASISASASFDIGEFVAFDAVEYKLKRTLDDGLVDPSRTRRSPANQPDKLFGRPYRTLRADIVAVEESGPSRRLRQILARTTSCAVIPLYIDPHTKAFDEEALHDTAMFGTMSQPLNLTTSSDALRWEGQMAFEEYPAA